MPIVTTVRGRVRPGPHIFIAIPCHGEISAPTFSSFFEAAQLLDAAGYSLTLCVEAGNCHVDDARNSLVREFLKSDCTDLVFIDADVGFEPENLFRLVSHDRDIVAGIYPKKTDEEDFPVLVSGELWADDAGLVEVEGAPTGFLRIRRRVLEALAEKAVSFIGQAGDPVPYRVIFERTVSGGLRRSGDYAFCYKAKQAGFRIYVDPEMAFTHTGAKTWAGTLGAFWKRRHGVEAQERAEAFDAAMKALKAGNPRAEDFFALSKGWGNEWAATPELLAHLWAHCSGRVLECGSGLSTLVLAAKGCSVTVLEHDPVFASHTAAMLKRYGLSARMLCKPLVDGWYDFEGGDFDALVIDGPPRTLGDRSIAVQRVTAPLVIWDDYAGGLDSPEIIEAAKTFAIAKKEQAV